MFLWWSFIWCLVITKFPACGWFHKNLLRVSDELFFVFLCMTFQLFPEKWEQTWDGLAKVNIQKYHRVYKVTLVLPTGIPDNQREMLLFDINLHLYSSFAVAGYCVVNVLKSILFENRRKLWFWHQSLWQVNLFSLCQYLSQLVKILQGYDVSRHPSLLPLVLQHKAAIYSKTSLIRLPYRSKSFKQNTAADANVLLLQLFSTWARVLFLRVRRMSYIYTICTKLPFTPKGLET